MVNQTASDKPGGQNGCLAPPGVKVGGSWDPEALLLSIPAVQGQRTEWGETLPLEKQSIHKRAQFHVFIFGRKEIIASLLTDNARPCKRAHSTCSISTWCWIVHHIQMSNRKPWLPRQQHLYHLWGGKWGVLVCREAPWRMEQEQTPSNYSKMGTEAASQFCTGN